MQKLTNMEFKDSLRKLMEEKGVTPYRIGVDTIVSKQSVMKYLKGTLPTVENVLALSDYFNVSCDYLLRGRDSQELTDALKENRDFRIKIDDLENGIAELKKRLNLPEEESESAEAV